ncbi:MAG: hypothetical protein RLZZ501_1060 [Pseudomonadota bacterium]
MSDDRAAPAVTGPDQALSFSVAAGLVRGRVVQLGPALDRILAAHADTPPVVAGLVAETALVAAALASLLKYDGVFTLQAQGDGPVRLVVADLTSAGTLRAMARFDRERLAAASAPASPAALLGAGHLAFTVDQGPGTDRYQGIVALEGDSLASAAEGYFRQSEQLDTRVRLAVAPAAGGGWFGRAALIQRLPAGSGQAPILLAEEAEETWRRAEILFGSLTEAELADPALSPERLLHRLYHGEDLRLTPARPLEAGCRCSLERVAAALTSLPDADLPGLADAEGRIEVTCEFCGTRHVLSLSDLAPRPQTA